MRSLLLAPLSLAAILSLTSGTVSRRSNPAQASTQDVKVIEVSAKSNGGTIHRQSTSNRVRRSSLGSLRLTIHMASR